MTDAPATKKPRRSVEADEGRVHTASANDDNSNALDLKQRMLDHSSIAKAVRVFTHHFQLQNAREGIFNADATSSSSHTPRQVAEFYCEFMTLKVLEEDHDAATAKFSPGVIVDEFWHLHVLDTAGYSAFFADVTSNGEMVHHDLEKSMDPAEGIRRREKATAKAYTETFGEACPFFSWDEIGLNSSDDDDDDELGDGHSFNIAIRTLTGSRISIDVKSDTTVRDVKLMITDERGIPVDLQRLIFNEKQLEDEQLLSECGVKKEATLHLVQKLCGC
eukprot:scaffold14397_cov214-Alexandrium_tamarense.AAC.4